MRVEVVRVKDTLGKVERQDEEEYGESVLEREGVLVMTVRTRRVMLLNLSVIRSAGVERLRLHEWTVGGRTKGEAAPML